MKTVNELIFIRLIENGELRLDEFGFFWKGKKRAEHKTLAGYLQLRKMISGKRHHICAHRVVYRYFKGPIPDGMIINHINGQKDDNRPANLQLSTHSKNSQHAYREGLHDQYGEKNPNVKLTDKQVAEIRLAYATGGFTQEQLGRKYSVSFKTISKIVRGERRPKQGGRIGKYAHNRTRGLTRDFKGRFIAKRGREWNEYPKIGGDGLKTSSLLGNKNEKTNKIMDHKERKKD